MAQCDCEEENSHCSRGSTITTLQPYFGDRHLMNNLISQIPTMKPSEQICALFSPLKNDKARHTGGLDESSDSLNQLEDCSPPCDISSALRAVALKYTWDVKNHYSPVPNLFSAPAHLEDGSALLDNQDESNEGDVDPVEEEMPSPLFQSKYIHIFPLYQDYCLQGVKDDLHRLKESFVSELITSQYLRSLQSCLKLRCHSETTSPQLNPPDATASSPATRPIRVTPCTLWQDLDEVKASGLLSSLTTREVCLQESMFELIGSEASYLRSLGVAVTHFYASKALKKTLSQMEHHILFSNIKHVMAASAKFLMDLEVRLGESVVMSQVADIVLQHCHNFRSLYVPYVTNMMYQEALINQQLQQNRSFLYSLKKLESDPVCQRQTLKSFLVLPFQRITRIKLLLESILKLTEPDSDSRSNLEKAIDAIRELNVPDAQNTGTGGGPDPTARPVFSRDPFYLLSLTKLTSCNIKIVTECDNGVRKMKRIEELVCLEMLLDFGKVKSVPLVVSRRFLVHQGPMKQLIVESSYNSGMSLISVYLHLFNDLLIISSKKDQRFIVVDHAEFPAHVTIEQLNTDVLGLPPDSFLLRLSQSQTGHPTAMILVPHTRSDKEAWMEALSSKQ